jgi:hypothetical protein
MHRSLPTEDLGNKISAREETLATLKPKWK